MFPFSSIILFCDTGIIHCGASCTEKESTAEMDELEQVIGIGIVVVVCLAAIVSISVVRFCRYMP